MHWNGPLRFHSWQMVVSKSVPVSQGPPISAPAALRAAWAEHRVPLMAALTAKLGDLDMAEEALAEAALRAQRSWAASIPANPSGWLYRVALNAARDAQRRAVTRNRVEPELRADLTRTDDDAMDVSPEARLRLFGQCAHPRLSPDQQIALILFHLAGLDCPAIARAFLVRESTIHQRLSRARRILRTSQNHNEGQSQTQTEMNLSAIRASLEIIYLQSFRNIAGGTEAQALGRDALQLAEAFCHAGPNEAESWALLSLLHALEARRPARLSKDDDFVPFDRQMTSRWSAPHMRTAAEAMQRCAALATSPQFYGLRAQIELTRMIAKQTSQTADHELLALHEQLRLVSDAPFLAVERALVLARVRGAMSGLHALDAIDADLSGHAGWHLAKAELYQQIADISRTRFHLNAALTLLDTPAEQAFVADKLSGLPS
ncbi:MAG: sigma-70 family RNA polymerase sigma factor [Pseudomonadota bacterium]